MMTPPKSSSMDSAAGGSPIPIPPRRRVTANATTPPPGSVWETRMKLDQVKGGIKVFDGHAPPTTTTDTLSVKPNQQSPGLRRKTWKSDIPEGSPNPIIQIAKQSHSLRSESAPNLDRQTDNSADKVINSRSGEEQEAAAGDSGLKKPVVENKSRSDDPQCREVDEQGKEIEIKNITPQQKNSKKNIDINGKPVPPITANQSRVQSVPSNTNPNSNNFHRIPRSNGKLQSFVDLVMWRDASKSAFVFGIGTFAIVSSSFTADLNISFISVVSYLGLVYLAANFLFRTLINRGSSLEMDGSNEYVVREEEAIWLIKLFLPYVNEFLVKLRALFSGDPATTMKLAVLLFVLAQCGSSITIWKMAKLGFFGIFVVPKVCSSYSSQISAYGTFWINRFRDAWKSCSHKKLIGFAVFALVWNFASFISRMWIVFMLFVGLKYYQQSCILISDECTMEEPTGTEICSQLQQRRIGGLQKKNGGGSPASAAYTRINKKVC